MIETTPWVDLHPDTDAVGPDAVTVEFSPQELLEALMSYAGTKRGENFPGYGFVQIKTEVEPEKKATVRLTYWSTP